MANLQIHRGHYSHQHIYPKGSGASDTPWQSAIITTSKVAGSRMEDLKPLSEKQTKSQAEGEGNHVG